MTLSLILAALGVVAYLYLTDTPPPRRPEPGVSALGSSEDEDDDAAWIDGDGTVRVPGEDVREGWLP